MSDTSVINSSVSSPSPRHSRSAGQDSPTLFSTEHYTQPVTPQIRYDDALNPARQEAFRIGNNAETVSKATKRYLETQRDRLPGVMAFGFTSDMAKYSITQTKLNPLLPVGEYEVQFRDGRTVENFRNRYTTQTWLNSAASSITNIYKGVFGNALKLGSQLPIIRDMNVTVPTRIRYVETEDGTFEPQFDEADVRLADMTPEQREAWLQGIRFNESEGEIRDVGEQNMRVSLGFATMGSADALSRTFFQGSGKLLNAGARFLDPETRQEQAREWAESGGLGGLVKSTASGLGKHIVRDHLADWHVGLSYVFIKELMMRKVGKLDTPEKEDFVMRWAFTYYNLYVDLVHNTGFDYLQDLLTGGQDSSFRQYRARHEPENADELNVLQKGWNFVMDGLGYTFENATEVFVSMMGAVTNFGGVRFRGVRTANEMKQKHRMDAWEDNPQSEKVRDYYTRITAAYNDALHAYEKEAKKYKMTEKPNFVLPTSEALIKAGHFTAEEIQDPDFIAIGRKVGFPSDSPTYRNYHRDLESFAQKASQFSKWMEGRENSPIGKLIDGLQGHSDTRKRGDFIFDVMMDAGAAYGMPDFYSLFPRPGYGEQNAKDGAPHSLSQTLTDMPGGGYASYIGKKRAFRELAENSSVIRAVTDSFNGITDSLKFGTGKGPIQAATGLFMLPVNVIRAMRAGADTPQDELNTGAGYKIHYENPQQSHGNEPHAGQQADQKMTQQAELQETRIISGHTIAELSVDEMRAVKDTIDSFLLNNATLLNDQQRTEFSEQSSLLAKAIEAQQLDPHTSTLAI